MKGEDFQSGEQTKAINHKEEKKAPKQTKKEKESVLSFLFA